MNLIKVSRSFPERGFNRVSQMARLGQRRRERPYLLRGRGVSYSFTSKRISNLTGLSKDSKLFPYRGFSKVKQMTRCCQSGRGETQLNLTRRGNVSVCLALRVPTEQELKQSFRWDGWQKLLLTYSGDASLPFWAYSSVGLPSEGVVARRRELAGWRAMERRGECNRLIWWSIVAALASANFPSPHVLPGPPPTILYIQTLDIGSLISKAAIDNGFIKYYWWINVEESVRDARCELRPRHQGSPSPLPSTRNSAQVHIAFTEYYVNPLKHNIQVTTPLTTWHRWPGCVGQG